MGLTPAEKQRYRAKLKEDPAREAEARRRHRERYHATKKSVRDLTEREHRVIKKRWRIANKKRSEMKKTLQRVISMTPESSPPPESAKQRGRKHVRRDRSALYRQNVKLQEELKEMKKKVYKYKKRLQRAKKSSHNTISDKYLVLANSIKQRFSKIKSTKERLRAQHLLNAETLKASRMKTSILNDCLGFKRLRNKEPIPRNNVLIETIRSFFKRDDVSRATAGKRETVTYRKSKMQKRYLLESMQHLFNTFKKENPSIKCSYSYFVKNRPFYVKPPSVGARETCLCRLHTNAQYILDALHNCKVILEKNMCRIIEQTVCKTDSLTCMNSTCGVCKTKTIYYNNGNDQKVIKWMEWVRKSEIIEKSEKKVKVTKNVKEIIEGTVLELKKKLENTLKQLKKHVYNIKTQYKAYRATIDNMENDEVVLHIDFSENYACKHFEEIQSHHFGGSRNQVTLHTGVMYHKSDTNEKPVVTSFCSVSSNNSHNPAAIWVHLHPILLQISDNHQVSKLHIFSDGPATQYRQKQNFYLFCSRLFTKYKISRATWNFFEAGHGKGAADGVGGFLKRAADRKVATGTDISDAESFFSELKDCSKIEMHFITDDEIQNVASYLPVKIKPLQGTLQVHQVLTDCSGTLKYCHLSCFCQRGFCSCGNPKAYNPIEEIDLISDEEILLDLTNMSRPTERQIYDTIYPSSSDSDSEPLVPIKSFLHVDPLPSTSLVHDLNDKENVHPTKLARGVYVLVKICSEKKQSYTYLGEALTDVEEDGEIKIMFYKTLDNSGKRFKSVDRDISYVSYEDILQIVPDPKKMFKGKREFYQFDNPLPVFEN